MLRVKVYRLDDAGKWDDQGTGNVTYGYFERSEELGFYVLDEVDEETILWHPISSEDVYRKQEDTIISWGDPPTHLALSFQEEVGCSYIWDRICCLQSQMQMQIRSNNVRRVHVADGSEINPLVPQENNSGMHAADAKVNNSGINVADRLVTQVENTSVHVVDGTEATPLVAQDWINSTMHVVDETEAAPFVPQCENISTIHVVGGTCLVAEGENFCSSKSSTSQLEGNKFHISLDELKLNFGKPLDEAAKDLGVSRSTLKRIRKSYGIHRWPSHKKNKVNQSLFIKENLYHAPHIGEEATLGSSGTDSAPAVLVNQTSIQSAQGIHQTDQHQTVHEVDKFITIKASYGDDVLLKFRLNHRSRLKDLEEEVAKRLKVLGDRCNLKYQDEDGDWISITVDEDLQSCLQESVARGQPTVRMSVHLN